MGEAVARAEAVMAGELCTICEADPSTVHCCGVVIEHEDGTTTCTRNCGAVEVLPHPGGASCGYFGPCACQVR